jgi:hypothetical protein
MAAFIESITQVIAHIDMTTSDQATFGDRIQQSMMDVAQATRTVAQQSTELQNSSQEVFNASSEAADNTKNVAKLAVNIADYSVALTLSSDQMRSMSDAVLEKESNIRHATTQITDRIHHTSTSLSLANDAMGFLSALIDELNQVSHQLVSAASFAKVPGVSFDVMAFKDEHLRQYRQVVEEAIGRQNHERPVIPSAQECPFGIWLKDEGLGKYGESALLKALEKEHDAFHTMAREALERLKSGSGERTETDALLNRINQTRHTLFDLIDQLYLAA